MCRGAVLYMFVDKLREVGSVVRLVGSERDPLAIHLHSCQYLSRPVVISSERRERESRSRYRDAFR